MSGLSAAVGWTSLTLGTICILLGAYIAFVRRSIEPQKVAEPTVGDQGAINDAIAGVADLGKALKDLDTSARLLTIGVLLVAIAAIVAGLDSIAQAIGTAGASSTG